MADILKMTFSVAFFLNENVWIFIAISLEFVPQVRIDNKSALVEVMAWSQTGEIPKSESMKTNPVFIHL